MRHRAAEGGAPPPDSASFDGPPAEDAPAATLVPEAAPAAAVDAPPAEDAPPA
jgi:hypothetical protein